MLSAGEEPGEERSAADRRMIALFRILLSAEDDASWPSCGAGRLKTHHIVLKEAPSYVCCLSHLGRMRFQLVGTVLKV